jgi:uncharacterized protein
MSKEFFHDQASQIKGTEITEEGFLHVPAHVGKPGILVYYRGDSQLDHIPEFKHLPLGTPIPILRDEKETFDPKSLASYRYKPVTNNHPLDGLLNSGTAKKHQVGMTKGKVRRTEDTIRLGLVITDQGAISDAQAGKRAISPGYTCELVVGDGVHPVWGEYKGKQTEIRCNHIAIVNAGRAGHKVRLGDEAKRKRKELNMPDKEILNLHRRTFGGVTVSFSDQGAEVVDGMTAKIAAYKKENDNLRVELADVKKKLDEAKGRLATLEDKQTDVAALDKAVNDRATLITDAKRLHPEIKTEGKTNTAIMLDALSKASTRDYSGKSDDFVRGAFLEAVDKAEKNANRSAQFDESPKVGLLDEARKKFIEEKSGRRV